MLREVLVGLLQDDPTLEPRDILVMCPDIETYAPLISAGFGLAPTGPEATDAVGMAVHPAHRLRVRLADRALVSTNPLLAVAGVLLELSGGRVTASDVLDLAAADPCRRRFGFTDDDLERAGRWVAATGIRWGLDKDARASFAMDRFPQNTWRTGLDRILLGVAMSGDDHRHLGTGLPLDDVGSSEIDLAGRLAELVDRLDRCLTALGEARSAAEWMQALRAGVRDLTDVPSDDAWQFPQLERELARAAAADTGGDRVELRLADVRALLGGRLAGRPTRANFRTGTLTVCTMVPMRSVPHRVVCLLGLDDGVFPRAGFVDGDDVLARHPRTGERDGRSEDRQLLLDAVMAATEHLVITYTGANEHSGARRPPAVPLGELLDAADRTTAAPVRDAILTRHPLQPYDPRNLKSGDPSTDPPEWALPDLRGPAQRPFSFDDAALAGARSAAGVRRPVPPLLTGDLPPRAAEDVTLEDLIRFLMHPVRTFLRDRLDLATPFEPDELGDAIPVALDSLEVWQVGDHLLRELLAGQDPADVMLAEQLRGTLPPYQLGVQALRGVTEECQKLWDGTAELRDGSRRSVDVDVDLGDGRRLTGTVAGVYGTKLVSLGYSRLKAKQRLRTWVELLALTASDPDQAWTGHAVGRERAGPKRALTGPLDQRALGWLRSLVELRDVGLTKPLPMPIATAAAWADAAREVPAGHGRRREARRPPRVGDRPVQRRRLLLEGGRGRLPRAGVRPRDHRRGAARPRPADVRLAGLGAAALRGREGGPAMSDPRPFAITDPLPTGTVLLEASAGTGKTWTIGALVARYVVEGVARLEQMLVVTFGRAASQELRERVRAQLVEAERVLSDDPADRAAASSGEVSELVAMLLAYDDERRRVGHRRVTDALVGFDAATIATTHQFCSMVLDSLGVAGDSDSRARLVEDLDDLVKEVVDDLYLRAFALDEDRPVFTYDEALTIARRVVDDPQARLEPAAEERTTTPGRRVSFARAVRDEMDRRKRRLGILSYDDLLSQLADALAEPDSPAAERMRQRWQVVLVDEFQDTDPVQWQVLDRAFTGHATMVLIGDPKQAIYAFRGGDVTTYLTAAATAATQQTLSVNWRSDAALLSSMQELLRGAALGDERIVVRDVEAHHTESRLVGAGNPFRVRVVRRQDVSPRPGLLTVGQVRPRIARDLAHDVRRLLDSGATFEGRPVRPRDIAVISYRHADLADAQAALAVVGVPGVIAGGGSVFATPAAIEWLTLLEALEQPHRSTRVRAAALTCFFGHTATDLDTRGDDLTDEVADTLRSWLELFGSRGLAAVTEAATVGGLPARVLAEVGGDRRLTDLRHIGEALHEAALTERHGLVSLLTWLREQVAEGRAGRGLERTRRLDSDAAAVQLVTIHASKGLEYPVVYLPAVADRHVSEPDLPRFHDDAGVRCRNVGAGGAGWSDSVRRAMEEDAGEWLRLLYVALTRAQSQVVCWWSPTKNTLASPLHRMLMRSLDTAEVPDQPQVPSDDAAVALFAGWRDRGGPAPEPATPAELAGDGPAAELPALGVRSFTRTVDAAWRRTSYSSLSAVRAEAVVDAVTSEPEVVGKDDEMLDAPGLDTPLVPRGGSSTDQGLPSPMANLPVGATFGSLVHAVLEHADPAAADFRAELLGHIDEQRGWWPVELDREELADALVAVCDSPLGGPGSGLRRRHAARRTPLRSAARDGLRAAAGGRRRARPHRRRPARRPRATAGAAPARGRPGPRLLHPAARAAGRPAASWVPHRLGRRRAARARPPTARGSTWSTTRPTGSARWTSH